MQDANIVIVGGGNMARALLNGLVTNGYLKSRLFVVERHNDKREALAAQFGIQAADHLAVFLAEADVLILAIKPKDAKAFAVEMGDALKRKSPLVISIMAGIDTPSLESWFGLKTAIVRAMPNTPAVIQAGATGLFANAMVTAAQKSQVEHLFRSLGIIAWLQNEADINSITALSGSGPAYFFYMLNCMQKKALEMGLDESVSRLFAVQTALGAARLALESNESLNQLCQQVTSKGGTTEAALQVFDKMQLPSIIEQGMEAAHARAKQMGEFFGLPKKLREE